MTHARPRAGVVALALAYAVGLALLVLTPIGWVLNRLTVLLYRVWNYDLGMPLLIQPEGFGVLLNVLLFVPVGVLLALIVTRRVLAVSMLGLLASAAIEVAQLVLVQRQAEVLDVVANTLGALVGAALVRARERRHDRVHDAGPPTAPDGVA